MPTAIAHCIPHLLSVNASTRISIADMSGTVAAEASGDDIVCRIETTILPCMKVFCGALKHFCLRRVDVVVSTEGFEIAFPHRQVAVVAAPLLGEVCVVTVAC